MKIGSIHSSISGVKLSPDLEKANKTSGAEKVESNFGEILSSKISEVDTLQKNAETATADLATGRTRNLHETILAMEMADTSLRLMVTVRNKALEAYQEIMRMPV